MLLTEKKVIKKDKDTKEIYDLIDTYCYKAKNLRNVVNYVIKQCYYIHSKLKQGEIIDSREKAFIKDINNAIYSYNKNKEYKLSYIDSNNGFISDAYFLSYYMKTRKEYKEMPYSVCSQQIIQVVCKDWKSYYKSIKDYNKNKNKYLGKPRIPKYYDKNKGRDWIILTNQNFKLLEGNILKLPSFLDVLELKPKHKDIRQLRIKTAQNGIVINYIYQIPDVVKKENNNYMGIDIGINNLMTVVSNTKMNPFIINGKTLKSINQYYNKRKSELQTKASKSNLRVTKRIERLTNIRNNKVSDYLHKASREVINKAIEYNISKIVIGNNKGWKQEVNMGKVTNQNFVSIPFNVLIQYLIYKAELVGIEVIVTEESYTSGTSYIDNEMPIKEFYNKKRRIQRCLFKSNNGIEINADVNGAYQILKKRYSLEYKGVERIERIKVA